MANRRPELTRVRLGVIGPPDLVQRTLELGSAFPALEVTGWPYTDERDAAELLHRRSPSADTVLFTGPVPYRLATAEIEAKVPITYVPLKGTGLYRTLYQARGQVDLERVSVDTLSRTDVEETYGELGLRTGRIRYLEGRFPLEREALVRFHHDAYREGKAAAALTCLFSVDLELRRIGVPSFWVTPTSADLRAAMDRALLLGSSMRSANAVLGIIAVDFTQPMGSEHELLRMRHDLYGLLLGFVEQFDGYLFPPGPGEYQFCATWEPFERVTDALTRAPILEELHRVAGGRVSMGVGIGRTANEAGTHARIALRRAQEEDDIACYVVLGNRRLVGPMGRGAAVTSDLRELAPQVLATARKAGMAGPTLDRTLAALRLMPSFTAVEAAAAIGVSLRSAHRLLSRLEQAGAVVVVGQEKLASAGRPRQVYQVVEPLPSSQSACSLAGPS